MLGNELKYRFIYRVVELKNCKRHNDLIRTFTIHRKEGIGLSVYLKKYALFDNIANENKTYLVLHRWNGNLVGYFSLKCSIVSFSFPEKLKKYEVGELKQYSEIMPSIEIAQLAVNDRYRDKLAKAHRTKTLIGAKIFSYLVVPKIKKIQRLLGVKMITLFALPYDKLIKNYEAWGFQKADDTKQFIKPTYDWHCVFMFREIDNT